MFPIKKDETYFRYKEWSTVPAISSQTAAPADATK